MNRASSGVLRLNSLRVTVSKRIITEMTNPPEFSTLRCTVSPNSLQSECRIHLSSTHELAGSEHRTSFRPCDPNQHRREFYRYMAVWVSMLSLWVIFTYAWACQLWLTHAFIHRFSRHFLACVLMRVGVLLSSISLHCGCPDMPGRVTVIASEK